MDSYQPLQGIWNIHTGCMAALPPNTLYAAGRRGGPMGTGYYWLTRVNKGQVKQELDHPVPAAVSKGGCCCGRLIPVVGGWHEVWALPGHTDTSATRAAPPQSH